MGSALASSEANLRRVVRGGEQCGDTTVALDPLPYLGRNPAGHFENAPVILKQVPREDRLMMGNPIPQLAETVERSMSLLARQGTAVQKHPTQRWPPERHFVIGPATRRIDATSGTEQGNPEAEGERGNDSRRPWSLAGACRLRLGDDKAIQKELTSPLRAVRSLSTPRVRLCLRVCARGPAFPCESDRRQFGSHGREYPRLATAFRLALASCSTARNSGASFLRRATRPERS